MRLATSKNLGAERNMALLIPVSLTTKGCIGISGFTKLMNGVYNENKSYNKSISNYTVDGEILSNTFGVNKSLNIFTPKPQIINVRSSSITTNKTT